MNQHPTPTATRRRFHAWAAAGALSALGWPQAGSAQEDSFPSRPIRLISPSPPGGGTDTASRLVATKLGDVLGWTVVVENRPGAGNNIGLEAGLKSPPDGYTLVMGETSNLAVNPFLFKKLSFDPIKDAAPVAQIGTTGLALIVPTGAPYQDYKAFAAAARTKPLSFASSGNGTTGHLVPEGLRTTGGLQFIHVPYKGAGPAMTDLVGGQVDFYVASLTSALPMVASGKARALAVTTAKRVPELPGVPTLMELGAAPSDFTTFYGIVAPARTPAKIVSRLNAEIVRILSMDDTRKSLHERGFEVVTGSPEQFAQYLAAERRKWEPIVKASGATVD